MSDIRTGEPLLSAHGLEKHFPITKGLLKRKVGAVKAVDGIDFDVYKGETLGLVGESGCGKSTTGRAMIRLREPTEGTVRFDGVDLTSLKPQPLRRLRRRMQIIFQDPVGSLNPRMPVSDIIGEGLLAQATRENGWGDRKVRDKRTGDYLEEVGLRRDERARPAREAALQADAERARQVTLGEILRVAHVERQGAARERAL